MCDESMGHYYLEQSMLDELSQEIDAEIWKTKDNKHIPIVQMSNQHLTNTIWMLLRKNSIKQLEESCPQWDNLIREAYKRGLEWRV